MINVFLYSYWVIIFLYLGYLPQPGYMRINFNYQLNMNTFVVLRFY